MPEQATLLFEDDPTGGDLAETVAITRVLEAAKEPLTIEQIARHFAQGKQIEKRAGLVVAALARPGHLSSADGGKTVSLRAA